MEFGSPKRPFIRISVIDARGFQSTHYLLLALREKHYRAVHCGCAVLLNLYEGLAAQWTCAFKRQPLFSLPHSADSEMDIFYLILRERFHLFRAESRGLSVHHITH